MPKRTPNLRNLAWGCCLSLIALACIAWSALPALDASPILRVCLFSGSGIAMLGLIFFFPDTDDRNARRLILGAALLLRLILWPAPVSDDVNRYLWEGQLVRDGGNPYSAPASDPRWEERRDASWQAMNHRDRATAYPPGIQWIMAGATAISPSLGVFKILALAGDLVTLLLLLGLLRHHAAPLRWAGFYAFNPVVLISFAAEAHFDSLMTAALLAALLAALRGKHSAWLWLGMAIQVKLVCLVLVPLFLTRRLLPGAWLLILVLILPSLPLLSGLIEWSNGVRHFASSGAFNAPLHTLLASTGLSLEIVRGIGTVAFGVSAMAVCIARWRGMALIDASLWMLSALLICSPIVHFWYLTWLLPLAAIRPSFAWTTLSITLGGYFIAWWTQAHAGWWGFGHGVAAFIWVPCILAGIAQHRSLPSRLKAARLAPESFRQCVVLPVLNAGPEVESLIFELRSELGTSPEIVVIDGGSSAETPITTAKVISARRGRGNQIAAGIAATDAPWIVIVHADSIPRRGWLKDLEQAVRVNPDASMFVFGQRFDRSGPGTLLIEAVNELRTVFGGVAFGDQTMVIRRSAMNAAGGFPAQPLMEDVEASLRLVGKGRVAYLGKEWTLSARKWGRGYFRRFRMVVSLVATYQIARMKGSSHAAAVSEEMYREYYADATDDS
jgi:hypothetical protein